jgi:beta-lactam-binding protein with PASTA domain
VADASAALANAGFINIAAEDENGNPVSAGTVLRTEPEEGSTVAVDEQVTLIVRAGSSSEPSVSETTEPEEVPVPFVIGETEANARAALDGFDVQVVYSDVPFGSQHDGRVMDQDPRINEGPVAPDATITLTVGDAPDQPPQTNPPQTNPPQTNPPQTNPPPTNPPATQPPPTQPPTTAAPPTTTTPATTTTAP